MSQILLVSLPIFIKRPVVIIIIVLGIICSLSKLTIVLGIAGIGIYILWVSRLGSFTVLMLIAFSLYALVGSLAMHKFETRKAMLLYSPSVYMRLVPILFYNDMPLGKQVLGAGKYGACELANKQWHRETIAKSGYINFEKQENCFLTNFSSIGSLLVDFGVIGVIVISALFTFLPNKDYRSFKEVFFRNRRSILCFWWFISFLNVYILTFVPAAYFVLGWILASDEAYN